MRDFCFGLISVSIMPSSQYLITKSEIKQNLPLHDWLSELNPL